MNIRFTSKEGKNIMNIRLTSKKVAIVCALVILAIFFLVYFWPHRMPPLSLDMRKSKYSGSVLQITNKASDYLICHIWVWDQEGTTHSRTFHCLLAPNKMQEVGFRELNGWCLESYQKALISTEGYADIYVTWDGRGSFSYYPLSRKYPVPDDC